MYNFKEIEKKWQTFWEENKTYQTKNDFLLPKCYNLVEFPYPSGVGLHVGHAKGHTAVDVYSRFKRMFGYNVLNAMGWDAFGLPAENFAIKNKAHPDKFTKENIETFKKQIKSFGPSFDWDREIDTTDPKYYKWTQWIFLQLFKAGLAYEKKAPINWCSSCKTGLSNEEVINGLCERCDTEVEQKLMKQWFLAITKYADKLEDDLSDLNWPEYIKTSQKNWIGKSDGCEFEMKKYNPPIINDIPLNKGELKGDYIKVYTTRIDTVFGMTYVVMAADHPQVLDFITSNQKEECLEYIENSKKKSTMERTQLNKNKTGVFTGSFVVNPFNNEKVPLWIADYVLGNYGTGAVMAVPAHDERDFEFAKKYALEIKQSIAPFFTSTSGDDKPQKNKKDVERNLVLAILKHNKKDKYLCLDWKQTTGWKSFVSGGTEGQSIDIAGIREIQEETGYKNIKFIKSLGFQEQYYYASHKDVNRVGHTESGLFELIDEEKDEIDLEELKKHTPVWINKEDIENFINLDSNKYFWEKLQKETAFTQDGILVNSKEFDGLTSEEAREKLTSIAQKNGFGKKVSNYKLRDWLFSRQRYRGEPIPLIHLKQEDLKELHKIKLSNSFIVQKLEKSFEKFDYSFGKVWIEDYAKINDCYIFEIEDNSYLVKLLSTDISNEKVTFQTISKIYDSIDSKIICDENLPLKLPEVENYEPTGTGESPLANVEEFVNVKLANNLTGKRETNTMPQWAGSSWYFLRYIDPQNDEEFASKENLKYFMPVDVYFGGAEHTTVHLLYSRFWNKALYDLGFVPVSEPYKRRVQHGLIAGEDGRKMSKRWGNVINPDDVIKKFGADTMRAYIMFMGPYGDSVPWSTTAIAGVNRFINKIYSLQDKIIQKDSEETIKLLHKTIKKIGEDIENISYHTAISSAMIFLNSIVNTGISKENFKIFLQILAPFIPFLTEEIWHNLGATKSIHLSSWPKYDENLVKDDIIVIGIQVLGKLRGELEININDSKEDIISRAKKIEGVKKWFEGKEIVKEIYVAGKIVNFVIK